MCNQNKIHFSDLPEGASFASSHDSGDRQGIKYIKGRPPLYKHKDNELPPNALIANDPGCYARFGPAAPILCPYCGSSNINPNGPGGRAFCRDCETQMDGD